MNLERKKEMTELQYEFDTMEEFLEANKKLSLYHNCEKCREKIVFITTDLTGQTCCGYCGMAVRYPKMKKEAFEKWLMNKSLEKKK